MQIQKEAAGIKKQLSYKICRKHHVIIRYMEINKNHIHYMIETEPTMSISKIVNLMKSFQHIIFGKGTLIIKEQKIRIVKTFGCCRFVYNQTLSHRKKAYENEKKSVSKTDCNNFCNRELKKEYKWLKEVDKFALTNAIYNMDTAYQKFFKEHTGYPKYKSKHDSHKSYTTNFTNENIVVDYETGKIKVPKLKLVRAKMHRKFTGKIRSATISQVLSGKYYVSVLVETEHEELQHTDKNIGLDLGIKDLCITSNGKKRKSKDNKEI